MQGFLDDDHVANKDWTFFAITGDYKLGKFQIVYNQFGAHPQLS